MSFSRRGLLRSMSLVVGALGFSRAVGAHSLPSVGAASPSATGGSDGPLVRLSLNENPYGPAPNVSRALQREFPNLCRYTGVEYDVLVDAIAAKERVPKE